MPDSNLTRLTSKNLLYLINTTVGSDLFRHIYVRHANGHEFDAIDDGDLSCAYVVTGILALVGLIDKPHATVKTSIQRLLENGWQKTENPIPGSIVHWPVGGEEKVEHIGFWLDKDTVMSNSSKDRRPAIHSIVMDGNRKPDGFYSHPELSVG